jgi:hypothetical protein
MNSFSHTRSDIRGPQYSLGAVLLGKITVFIYSNLVINFKLSYRVNFTKIQILCFFVLYNYLSSKILNHKTTNFMRILSLYYIFKESIYHKICTIYKILTHCSGRDMLLLKSTDFYTSEALYNFRRLLSILSGSCFYFYLCCVKI